MAQSLHKTEINSNDFTRCGEISTFLSKDNIEFYLNCEFCEFTFIHLNNFIQHIYDDHLSELPRSIFKQETRTTSIYSQESRDYDDFENDVEETLEDDLDELKIRQESENTEFVSDDFEMGLLDTNDVDIKGDFSQGTTNEENVHTHQTGIDNDDDDDVDKMVSDSENGQSIAKSHRRKTQQNYTHVEANDVDGTKEASFDKRSKSKPIFNHIKITDAILNDSQCIILAEIYKENTCLWDENDIAYRFKNRRDEALSNVHQEFRGKTGLNITECDVKREILRLRKICSYEKKQKIIYEQNKLEYKASCTYYDYIKFLEVDVCPFVCSICGELYPALGKLKVHMATHDGSLPFKCHICGHGFQVGTNLTVHLRRHARDYTYNCEVCNKTCATTTELKIHMRTHTGERPFVCSICGKRFLTSSQLLDHTNCHEKLRRFKCEICLKGFNSPGTLKEHRKTHLKVRDFICDICDKGFKSRKRLNQHKHIHDREKRYICKICGKSFAQSAGLYGHMKSHGAILTTKDVENNQK